MFPTKSAKFSFRETGEPIFWGESFMVGLLYGPNPAANLVGVGEGLDFVFFTKTKYPFNGLLFF